MSDDNSNSAIIILLMIIALTCATSADAAESWTCSPNGGSGAPYRFTISPPDVTSTLWDYPFHIVHNDERFVVATGLQVHGARKTEPSKAFIHTLSINKVTGEYVVASFEAGEKEPDLVTHGRCLRD
jgi:hypothetical protein